MTVVIPTGQYANIQPTVTGIGETFEQARNDALTKAGSFYENVETQASLNLRLQTPAPVAVPASTDSSVILKCWATGTEVFYDAVAHAYVDAEGNKYVSGSAFAHQYEHDFNKAAIIPGYATRYGVKEYEVEEMWADKGESSTTFGTALHKAMETYLRHHEVAVKCGKDPLEMIHPLFRPLVQKFFTPERLANGKMIPEVFVADKETFRCGQLDIITVVDEQNKILDIEDYKTNVDLFKVGDPKHLKAPYSHLPNMPAAKYTLQLSFYKAIFESRLSGWTVRSIKLHQPILKPVPEMPGVEDWVWDTVELRPESINLERIDVSTIV